MFSFVTDVVPLAASSEEGGSSFIVSPDLGLMIWVLLVFGISLLVLRKLAFPKIGEFLDQRQGAIDDSIDAATKTKEEAEALLVEYRERLAEARKQAEEIVERARKAGDAHEQESLEAARKQREDLMSQTRRDIESETNRAIQEIRREVADLTVLATEKVTRKVLTADDQQRLVDEALSELDFTALTAGAGAKGGND